MLTGLPEAEPDVVLVRVLTGAAEPERPVDPPPARLVRVVTGAVPGLAVTGCEPLAWVLIAPAAAAADPDEWAALVRVLAAVPVP